MISTREYDNIVYCYRLSRVIDFFFFFGVGIRVLTPRYAGQRCVLARCSVECIYYTMRRFETRENHKKHETFLQSVPRELTNCI